MDTQIVEVTASPFVADSGVMALQHKSEIEAMVDTAHKYPRNMKTFENEAITMATLDEETASSMFYTVPRGGKQLIGPSIRLMEICAVAWGNLRYGARIVSVEQDFITAQGFAFDAQKNTGVTVDVRRRITDKYGKRFNDDMIQVTGQAAASLALRNALLRVIPKVYVDKIFRAAREVALGKGVPIQQRRQKAMDAIKMFGVDEARILASIGKPSVKDIDADDLVALLGMFMAVKNGERTVEETWPEAEEEAPAKDEKPKSGGAGDKVAEKMKAKKEKAPKPEPVAEPEEIQEEPIDDIPKMGTSEWADIYMEWPESMQAIYDDANSKAVSEGVALQHAHEMAYLAAIRAR